MKHSLHPAAALEHKRQIVYYEDARKGLGRRYHADFRAALNRACSAPLRARLIHSPDIRYVGLDAFAFDLIYRVVDGTLQVLAVAHHRREPGYWLDRA